MSNEDFFEERFDREEEQIEEEFEWVGNEDKSNKNINERDITEVFKEWFDAGLSTFVQATSKSGRLWFDVNILILLVVVLLTWDLIPVLAILFILLIVFGSKVKIVDKGGELKDKEGGHDE